MLVGLVACGSQAGAPAEPSQTDAGASARETLLELCGHSVPTLPPDAGDHGLERYLQSIEVPVDPGTLAPVCAKQERPIIFFAAHPDDETIGMAGAIRQSLEEGRPVFVELMTHGEASFVRGELSERGTCAWHSGRHVYALSVEDFGDARVREFLDALHRLGVTGVHVSGYPNMGLTPAQVGERISYWTSRNESGLSLRGTAGKQDPESAANPFPQPDHAAVWEALVASGHDDVLGYCIYEALTGLCHFDDRVSLGSLCEHKREALSAYELWDPDNGRFGIAYHSTHGLLDSVAEGCHEWVVRPGDAAPKPRPGTHGATINEDTE